MHPGNQSRVCVSILVLSAVLISFGYPLAALAGGAADDPCGQLDDLHAAISRDELRDRLSTADVDIFIRDAISCTDPNIPLIVVRLLLESDNRRAVEVFRQRMKRSPGDFELGVAELHLQAIARFGDVQDRGFLQWVEENSADHFTEADTVNVIEPLLAVAKKGLALRANGLQLGDFYDEIILQINSVGQSYGGQYVDQLAALGPDGIPAIGRALQAEHRFPITYVKALERIGDRRATVPLLVFLEKRFPLDAETSDVLSATTILAIGRVGDDRAVDSLLQVLRLETVHPKIGLAAATALAQVSNGDARDEARNYIFDRHTRHEEFVGKLGAGFELQDLFVALVAVDTDSSIQLLTEYLDAWTETYQAPIIIRYFSSKNRADLDRALLDYVDRNRNKEVHLQLLAVEGVLDSRDSYLASEAQMRLRQLYTELLEDGSRDELIKRAEALLR